MPLVFVHGVANRIDGPHVEEARVRQALFEQYVTAGWSRADGGPAEILQPYWGGDGASLAWGGASVPNSARVAERFGEGVGDGPLSYIVAQVVPDDARIHERLLTTARTSMGDALDLLWTAALLASPDRAKELAAASALTPSLVESAPAWLAEVGDDEEFAVRLCQALEDIEQEEESGSSRESFGVGQVRAAVQEGVVRIRETLADRTTSPVADRLRAELAPRITEFLGDVLTYYRRRPPDGAGAGIGGKIADVLREANALRGPRDPFVLVAHSMGGNIVYDLLSGPLAGEDLTVDLLVTAGSQVAFFEELSLFSPHPPDVPGTAGLKLPRPPAVRRWMNVYDMNDLLSFRAEPVFEGVEDHSFRSGRLRAHSAYFLAPSFYARLGERLGPLRSGPQAPADEDGWR